MDWILDDSEPIVSFRPWAAGARPEDAQAREQRSGNPQVRFDRHELTALLGLYGGKVAEGEWRDYAIDFGREKAVFSVYRRSSEVPLYSIVKDPSLARKQGIYSVMAPGGLILKRGHDLAQVLKVLMRRPKLATV